MVLERFEYVKSTMRTISDDGADMQRRGSRCPLVSCLAPSSACQSDNCAPGRSTRTATKLLLVKRLQADLVHKDLISSMTKGSCAGRSTISGVGSHSLALYQLQPASPLDRVALRALCLRLLIPKPEKIFYLIATLYNLAADHELV